MPKFTIKAMMDTYAEVEIEAPHQARAIEIANGDGDLDWHYDTDYDSSKIYKVVTHDEEE